MQCHYSLFTLSFWWSNGSYFNGVQHVSERWDPVISLSSLCPIDISSFLMRLMIVAITKPRIIHKTVISLSSSWKRFKFTPFWWDFCTFDFDNWFSNPVCNISVGNHKPRGIPLNSVDWGVTLEGPSGVGHLCPQQKYDSTDANDIWYACPSSILKYCQNRCNETETCNQSQRKNKF